jgi:hypothetical protein
MRWNGSVIGKLDLPTQTSASGVWSLRAQTEYFRAQRWPFALPVTANLAFWIDASQPSTVTLNGSSVLQIQDLSSNQRLVNQTTGARQPEYVLAARNGLNVMRFTSASQHFLNMASLTIPASHTVFTVFSRSASATASSGVSSGNGNRYPFYWQTSNVVTQRSNGTSTTHGSANTGTGWFYSSTRRNGTSSIIVRRNGSLVADVTTGLGVTDAAVGNWTMIGRPADTVYIEGDIGEIIAYETNLSDSDIASVEAYLVEKWAI